MATVGGPTRQTSFDQIFLYSVKHRPQIRALVIEPACRQHLAFSDRQHLVRAVVLEHQCRARKDLCFAIVEHDSSHGFVGVLYLVEATQDFIGALDDMFRHVALVRHTDVTDDVAAHQTVLADKAEHARQHLIAARTVVTIEQDNFIGLFAIDLARMTKPEHVLGEFTTVFVTHAGLAHHEGLEPFIA